MESREERTRRREEERARRQNEMERRELEQHAENEKLAQRFAIMRDENGLSMDPNRFADALQICIEDWQGGFKKSNQNRYVWLGPTDVSAVDIIREGRRALSREPLYFLERCLDISHFPGVKEIRRFEGFSYCLGKDDDSLDDEIKCLGTEEGRAYMVSVETIEDNSSGNYGIIDAFTLLQSSMYSEEETCVKEALKALEPLLRGQKSAVLIDYSDDNRICGWDEGTYYPSVQVLLFEHSGQHFSLVTAGMGWRYEWQDY